MFTHSRGIHARPNGLMRPAAAELHGVGMADAAGRLPTKDAIVTTLGRWPSTPKIRTAGTSPPVPAPERPTPMPTHRLMFIAGATTAHGRRLPAACHSL